MKALLPVTLIILIAACAPEQTEQVYATAKVEERDIVVAVQAAGIIEPETTVEVKSKASGEVLKVPADTGTVLNAGDLLVQIDKRTPRNMLAQAEAEVEAARARRDIAKTQSDRAKKLLASGTLNQVDYEQSLLEYANAKAEVVRAQVSVENARIALDDTEVRAPIAGTIIEKTVEQGQVISSPTQDVGGGTLLLKMADLRSVQVKALVDETDIGKIQPGQLALVTVTAYPNQPFRGEVIKLEPKAEEELTVTMFSVLVTIDNELGLLRPGMNAEVDINIASRYDIPAVPTMALRTRRDISAAASYLGLESKVIRDQLAESALPEKDNENGNGGEAPDAPSGNANSYMFGGKYWVFLLREGQPVPVNVETGLTDLDYSEVVAGLQDGDEVIMLPSSGFIESRDRFRKWMGEITGVPGMNKGKDDEEEDEE